MHARADVGQQHQQHREEDRNPEGVGSAKEFGLVLSGWNDQRGEGKSRQEDREADADSPGGVFG